ncbi:hypothetical protein HDU80_007675 [Chytriomyces hyalinus]|nr:hypothetical protein HDU80_007675 [Chytriomyces hyalinus]
MHVVIRLNGVQLAPALDVDISSRECAWNGIRYSAIRESIKKHSFDGTSTRPGFFDKKIITLGQEAQTLLKYNPLVDSKDIAHVHVIDPDSFWIISLEHLPSSRWDLGDIMIPLSHADTIPVNLTHPFDICDETGHPIGTHSYASVSEVNRTLGARESSEATQKCSVIKFRFFANTTTNRWTLQHIGSLSINNTPTTNDTEYMTCLQELGQLDSKTLFSDFMDDSHGLQVIQASGKIAENISTSMEVLTKVTSYSGNVAKTLEDFNFKFAPILNGLNCLSNVVSVIPFMSSVGTVISAVVTFTQKMEQNEKDIVYLKQHGQLLKETIEMRVSAYFKPDSNIIVDDEQLQMSYCKTLSNGAKVLINVVETVCQFQNRGWLNKMLKAGAGVDVTSSERSLDFAIKSIIALDPIQKTFNMNSIMPHFKSQEALHFWKSHRFRYCAQGDRLCEAVIKKAIRVNVALEQPGTAAILQVELFKRLNAESTGFINSIDFGEWYSEENLSALVTTVVRNSTATNVADSNLAKTMDKIYFGAEIESQLNDRIPETREWLLDSIIKSKASIILLVAGPGFGKSIISAWAASNWKCIHYFFKVDDARMRTALNFVKNLLLQLHDKLRKTRIQEAVALESTIHESLDVDGGSFETLSPVLLDCLRSNAHDLGWIVVDAFDECPHSDQRAVWALLEEIARTDAALKILVTSRPNAATQPAPKFPHPHQRIDSGLSLDETVFEPTFEVLSDLESRPENFEDVRVYFESTLRLATERGITILTTKSNGNFLWARLAVSIIRSLNEEEHIPFVAHTALHSMLSQQYLICFGQSIKMPSVYQEGLKSVMSLVLAFAEPVKVEVVQHFWTSSWMDDKKKDPHNEEDYEKARTLFLQYFTFASSRLLIRTNYESYVWPGHKSLRDLLQNNQLASFVDVSSAHKVIANYSLEILENFDSNVTKTDQQPSLAIKCYAAKYWATHVHEMSGCTESSRINTRVAAYLNSPVALHWITLMASMNQLPSVRSTLTEAMKNDVDCARLIKIIDRFSNVLLTEPEQMYKSVAVMCLQNETTSDLFSDAKTLNANFQPRVLLGGNRFWLESNAFLSSVKKRVLHSSAFSKNIVLVYNSRKEALRDPVDCEVWDAERNTCISKIFPVVSRYKWSQYVDFIVCDDGLCWPYLCAVFEGENTVFLWRDYRATPNKISLESPLRIQVIQQAGVNPTILIVCKKAIAKLEFKNGFMTLRILAAKLREIKNSSDDLKVRSIVCDSTVWLAILDGKRLRVFSSEISESKCCEQIILNSDVRCCLGFDMVAANNTPRLLFHSKAAVTLLSLKDMKNLTHQFDSAEITHASFNLDTSLISLVVASDFIQLATDSFDQVLRLDGLAPTDSQILHANCSGSEYILTVRPTVISCIDPTSKKGVLLLEDDISSFTFTGETILFSNVHGRVSTYQLDMLIQTALCRDSCSVNNLMEPFYESDMAISENGMLYTIQMASSGTVNIWNLYEGGQHVQTIEKAAKIEDSIDNSELWASKDGSKFVALSSNTQSLAWWTVSDPELPELYHFQKIRHWVRADIAWSTDLESAVFRSSEDNLLYLTERGMEYVEVQPTETAGTFNEAEDDNGDVLGFSFDDMFSTGEEPSVSSYQLILNHVCCYFQLATIQACNWLISASDTHVIATNLSSSQYSLLPVSFCDGRDSASVAMTFGRLKDASTSWLIATFDMKALENRLLILLGFKNGCLVLLEFQDNEFKRALLVSNSLNDIKRAIISISPAVLTVQHHTGGDGKAHEISLFSWTSEMNGSSMLLSETCSDILHIAVQECDKNWGGASIILTRRGELFSVRHNGQDFQRKLEFQIPGAFMSDKCNSMKVQSSVVVLSFKRMFLVLDLGRSSLFPPVGFHASSTPIEVEINMGSAPFITSEITRISMEKPMLDRIANNATMPAHFLELRFLDASTDFEADGPWSYL